MIHTGAARIDDALKASFQSNGDLEHGAIRWDEGDGTLGWLMLNKCIILSTSCAAFVVISSTFLWCEAVAAAVSSLAEHALASSIQAVIQDTLLDPLAERTDPECLTKAVSLSIAELLDQRLRVFSDQLRQEKNPAVTHAANVDRVCQDIKIGAGSSS
ncbi:hypothetical protein BJ741DRAFT_582092 [Chytriomyces cf. hyalinus JEL632]|nr:hypothetical protein BJ741DRAFT_582092 [Chytriomyces cf. hyalinus JEL632]